MKGLNINYLELKGIWKDRCRIFYKRSGKWVDHYEFLFDKETLTNDVISKMRKKLKSKLKIAKLVFVETDVI